jgi:hypothetical protein
MELPDWDRGFGQRVAHLRIHSIIRGDRLRWEQLSCTLPDDIKPIGAFTVKQPPQAAIKGAGRKVAQRKVDAAARLW